MFVIEVEKEGKWCIGRYSYFVGLLEMTAVKKLRVNIT
jgi:hypothetical protein